MSTLSRILVVIFCLFAAIACFTFGMRNGGVVFAVAGLIFEGVFWVGIFGRKKKKLRPTRAEMH